MGHSDVSLKSEHVMAHTKFNDLCASLGESLNHAKVNENLFQRHTNVRDWDGISSALQRVADSHQSILSKLVALKIAAYEVDKVYENAPELRVAKDSFWGECLEIKQIYDENSLSFQEMRADIRLNSQTKFAEFSTASRVDADDLRNNPGIVDELSASLLERVQTLEENFTQVAHVENDLDVKLTYINMFNQYYEDNSNVVSNADEGLEQLGILYIEALEEHDHEDARVQMEAILDLTVRIHNNVSLRAMRELSENIDVSHNDTEGFVLPEEYSVKRVNPEEKVEKFNETNSIFQSMIRRSDQFRNSVKEILHIPKDDEDYEEFLEGFAQEIVDHYDLKRDAEGAHPEVECDSLHV